MPSCLSDIQDSLGCLLSEPLNWLARLGVRNTVMMARPMYGKDLRRGGRVSGDDVRYFRLPGSVGLSTAGAFLFAGIVGKIREVHRKQKIDVLHAHGTLPSGHAAMLVHKELNIPYVVTVYEGDEPSILRSAGRAGKWSRRISQRVYAESRRVVCVSEYVREQVLDRVGRSCRTSVVYNGVDQELFCPPLESKQPAAVILNLGNSDSIEGQDVLVRAVANLKKEFPPLSLDIIGEGPEHLRLRKLAIELNIPESVRFMGSQLPTQIAHTMKSCMLFVLPSRSEELGCKVLEAMSCGKPVVVGRHEGITEIIQHGTNGFLVLPDNEKQLELATGMLLREPQRRMSLGAAARNTVLDRFTVQQQAENLMRIYRECTS